MEQASNEKTFRLEIVSAERNLFSGEASFVVVPGVDGELGIYRNHTPLLTKIKPGTLKFQASNESEETLFFVAGGFLEVQPTYASGYPNGMGSYTPPYYNPYDPTLVSHLKQNEREWSMLFPRYYSNWLNKKNHFDLVYNTLKEFIDVRS